MPIKLWRQRKPGLLVGLMDGDALQAPLEEAALRNELSSLLAPEDAELGTVLRVFRQRHMLRIVWRDFCRLADTLETVRDVSLLAEACIAEALQSSQAALEQPVNRLRRRVMNNPGLQTNHSHRTKRDV